jgi:hypothetical protein
MVVLQRAFSVNSDGDESQCTGTHREIQHSFRKDTK